MRLEEGKFQKAAKELRPQALNGQIEMKEVKPMENHIHKELVQVAHIEFLSTTQAPGSAVRAITTSPPITVAKMSTKTQ